MKKYLLIPLLLIVIGCSDERIKTEIEENDNYVSSITYPVTQYSNINKDIKNYIREKKKQIRNGDERQELNIDFKQNVISDRYINIKLITTLNNETEVKTFVYENNKKLSIYDILTDNDLQILDSYVNTDFDNLSFDFDEENLYVYKEDVISIPLHKFDLKIKIEKRFNEKDKYTYKEIVKTFDKNKKFIAITFDDGPSIYTEKIVDLLNEYEANATFFVLGNKVETYKETLMYLLDSGNEIGNHTYSHKWLTHTDQYEIVDQINSTQEVIKSTLDYTPTLFRPTYGSVNNVIRNNADLDIVLWNIDSLDWKYKNSKKIYNHIISKVGDSKIILMHDTHKYTYNALKLLLPKLKEDGYQIVTVSDLKNAR